MALILFFFLNASFRLINFQEFVKHYSLLKRLKLMMNLPNGVKVP